MAKRFTDTDKWKREWFCDLDLKAKIVWFYLLDQCDHRGVWYRNFKLMSDQVGFKVTEEDLIVWFDDKLSKFEDDKYFIQSFVDFQYGELNPTNNAHKSIISLIEYIANKGPTQPLISPSKRAQDKDKDKDKDKESFLKGGLGEKKLHQIGELWNSHAPKELARIQTTDGKRAKAITRVFSKLTPEQWEQTFKRIEKSDWLRGIGDGSKGWRASFDWSLENYAKIIEGNYDNRKSSANKHDHLRDAETVADDFNSLINEVRGES